MTSSMFDYLYILLLTFFLHCKKILLAVLVYLEFALLVHVFTYYAIPSKHSTSLHR